MIKLETVCAFVLVAVLAEKCAAIDDQQKAAIQGKFLEVGAECIKEHPLTPEDVVSLKDKKLPDSENAGCFTACLFKNIGLMDSAGNLSHGDALEKSKTIFTAEDDLKNLDEFLKACSNVNDADVSDGDKGCDRAKLIFNCFVENSGKFGLDLVF